MSSRTRHRHPSSPGTSAGTRSARQTTESSSGVRVTEVNGPATQGGTGASGANRQTVYAPGMATSRRCGAGAGMLM